MNMLRVSGAAAVAVFLALSLSTTSAHAAATGTGVIEGGVTDQAGAPSDATVTVRSVDGEFEQTVYSWDFPDGRYRFEGLEPGSYQVKIYDNYYGTQWIPGAETRDDAKVFEVTDGATVTADDTWLPFGTVRVEVTDRDTGRPVPRPCAYVHTTPQDRQKCGAGGVVELTDIAPGYWDITVSGGPSYFTDETEQHVTVERSRTTEVTSTLAPGAAVTTRVVDNATGEPLNDVCVHLVDPVWSGQSAHMPLTCSDADGTLEMGPYEGTFDVNLYAFQSRSVWNPPTTLYGDQWVGDGGGTGDQREALKVRFADKQTRTMPEIRMDPPGTITGTIRDAGSGQPVSGVCAYPYAFHPGQGGISGKHCSNAQGTYVIDDVGPYRWPVEFTPFLNKGYAYQWSGDVADRFAARYSLVTAGGSMTVDAGLVRSGAFAGKVTKDAKPVFSAYVVAYNATTHDVAGPSWAYSNIAGEYTLAGYRTQDLLVNYYADGVDCWHADPVHVVSGATTNLPLDMVDTCGASPVPPGVRGLLSAS